ncbi:MAG: tetratricopeptide repeat protein [Thermoleophilia bacterium]
MDRKRINRWTRWFAIILAIMFALGTVFLGVGSSTGNLFSGCSGNSSSSINSSSSLEDREAYFKELIIQNPQDKDSMLALANLYAGDDVGRYDDAIVYYNNYFTVSPQSIDVMLLLGKTEMKKGDNEAAVKTLSQATQTAPTNAYAFFMLGQAAKSAGQNQTAILAWSRFLELSPNDNNASLIKEEITKLTALPAVTPQTSTVSGSPGTSVPVTPAP